MNSKERVLSAINLEVPDRVPMDFSANEGTLNKIYNHLRVNSHKELLETLHVDILDMRGVIDPVYQGPVPEKNDIGNGIIQNYWGWRQKTMQTATGPEEMFVDFIFKNVNNIKEMEKHHWPEIDWFDFSDIAERLKSWQNFAIMVSGPSIFQHPSFLRGLDNLLIDMMVNQEIAHYLMNKFTDFYVKYFDKLITATGNQVEILRIADDLGMQNGPLISEKVFNDFFVPKLIKIIDMAHSHGVKVMFHSCGSIINFIDRIIEIGIDILDPIQVRAKGMDPMYLKKNYNDKICFHGSIDTQYTLPVGSAEEVEKEVKKMIEILGENGGFILAPSHVLQTDVPLNNIEALYIAGYKYGKYVV
jgi:uroporphyrinogen decarboxylase